MTMHDDRQTARSVIRLGKHVKFEAELNLSPAGLIGVTALVCGILLSTTLLVTRTIREARR